MSRADCCAVLWLASADESRISATWLHTAAGLRNDIPRVMDGAANTQLLNRVRPLNE
ncbi:hypothetical protein PF005_g23815 [Phytophthora fragariae]|uniref:Uncharacterized protein n=1 Tax=Phytophthora fragariae TaxID=53985 RepID=A0A6A3ICG1_9STRA|nr:hypothetical protein PF003_g15291 [Phytophthora fragariae]KAE8925032.1 hypothetical protein PF009_g24749 [Phytophthora fragariae]KAE8979687.1 hypothetical protein PF011_g22744 [Phytophthora fragariae]KAE9077745.1 hypothetical protein PF010_g23393 [Phytophthora fragariae]KAE9078177.1 hypothetical protein PF007_g23963 [Phytophthora fragariae]